MSEMTSKYTKQIFFKTQVHQIFTRQRYHYKIQVSLYETLPLILMNYLLYEIRTLADLRFPLRSSPAVRFLL